ncbi:exodeoxyribonuclease III [Auritidibacter sp. NML120636]|uniref:exodeoxyribonuclease III n=1 Tax=Auritidibacter TaxID=1160973 RepID=UPI000D734D0F|nr:exodeoxyribonuclease III [Auritidibacter sp. NML120636]
MTDSPQTPSPETTAPAWGTASVRHAHAGAPKPQDAVRVATVNVNGIRAAYRREMKSWFDGRGVDILALQEVRANGEILRELLGEITGDEWDVTHIHDAEAEAKGRAGVAVASRWEFDQTRTGIGDSYFDNAGRWVEVDLTLPSGQPVTVVSAYVHSGEVDTPKQDDKYRFLDQMLVRMPELATEHRLAVVTGDLNVGHTELDIKNWKGNVKNSGFLPEERAYFDRFFDPDQLNWVDVGRSLAGDIPGPYTWWSYRGKAFDNDAGWRIDYQIATPDLADKAITAVVDRAPSYDTRFSDHSPLVVDYQF